MRVETTITETALCDERYERLEPVQWRREDSDQDNNSLRRENARLLAALKRQIADAFVTVNCKLNMLE